jgi:peroxisomal coenzyme A diphosphatase NUDT7
MTRFVPSSTFLQIMAAVIAYDRPPSFSRFAPGQPATFNDILHAVDATVFFGLHETGLINSAATDSVTVGRE